MSKQTIVDVVFRTCVDANDCRKGNFKSERKSVVDRTRVVVSDCPKGRVNVNNKHMSCQIHGSVRIVKSENMYILEITLLSRKQ